MPLILRLKPPVSNTILDGVGSDKWTVNGERRTVDGERWTMNAGGVVGLDFSVSPFEPTHPLPTQAMVECSVPAWPLGVYESTTSAGGSFAPFPTP